MSQLEEDPARLKPLLGRAFSSFAGRKCVQHGAVEHYCPILKGIIAYTVYAFWVLELLMWRFWDATV